MYLLIIQVGKWTGLLYISEPIELEVTLLDGAARQLELQLNGIVLSGRDSFLLITVLHSRRLMRLIILRARISKLGFMIERHERIIHVELVAMMETHSSFVTECGP